MATAAIPASFNRLPVELMLKIAFYVSDLPSLYALDLASTHFALVFNEYGYHILESVMSMPGQEQPRRQVYEIIRLVVHIRTICFQPDKPPRPAALFNAFMSQHFKDSPDSAACNPIPSSTPPSVLRGVLATATKITRLTSLCLAEHMRRCLALRPSHPIDRTMPQLFQFSGIKPEYFNRSGYAYTPHSSGSPSWLETQRALRALWSVQLYLNLCQSVLSGHILFAADQLDDDEIERLGKLDVTKLEDFGPQPEPMLASERAVTTVVEYLWETMGWRLPQFDFETLLSQKNTKNGALCLPWPNQDIAQDFKWNNEGIRCFPACEEDCGSQYAGLAATSIQVAPGEQFLDRMWYMQRFSPVFDMRSLPIFRRLGMAFWDSRRLMELELLGRGAGDGFTATGKGSSECFHMLELAYTWKSIADAAS